MHRPSRRHVLKTAATAVAAPALVHWLGSHATADDPYADALLLDGPPPLPAEGSFTVAVLPDTQNYSEHFPQTYLAQTAWIVAQRQARNIAAVFHLGDITNRNTAAEWQVAAQAMHQLDDHVPYFLVPGNHDYSDGGNCQDRITRLNDYFPVSQFQSKPTFGGVYDREPNRLENSFHHFSAGGREFLVLALEFGPRRDVLRWANEVVSRFPQQPAILLTHAYLYDDDTRYDWRQHGPKQSWNPHSYGVARASSGDVTDGEELWQELVARHDNFILTLNGHVLHDGLGRTVTATPAGRDVHQVLVNFQMRPAGGDGWLRLLEFRADGRTVEVFDFSPTRNQRNESPQNRFSMTLSI